MLDYAGLEQCRNELKEKIEALRDETKELNILREKLMFAGQAVENQRRIVDKISDEVDLAIGKLVSF